VPRAVKHGTASADARMAGEGERRLSEHLTTSKKLQERESHAPPPRAKILKCKGTLSRLQKIKKASSRLEIHHLIKRGALNSSHNKLQ
jgi:hypothetical protein